MASMRNNLCSSSDRQRVFHSLSSALIFALCGFLTLLICSTARAQAKADDERMGWWRAARFGIFIHWGIYSVAAGEWNGKAVPGVGEWIMHNGNIPRAEYETLAPRFNPVEFNADEWVRSAANAGMKYIVITSKHHDGFCMFDSAHTTYDIIDATPFDRDPLRELVEACRRAGIRIGFYYSIMDWHHPDATGESFPRYLEYLRAQIRELLTNYGPIDILWFDGEWIEEWTPELGEDLYRLCRELQPQIIVNNRVGKGRSGMADAGRTIGDFGTPEQAIPSHPITEYDWETCMTMNDSWGFKRSDENWKAADELIRNVIRVASRGGNYLLNVGPTATGRIPEASVERLGAVGRWLKANGESIYATSAGPFWRTRLPIGGCTARGNRLYLHVFDQPTNDRLEIHGLQNEVAKAATLIGAHELAIEQAAVDQTLRIHLPAAGSEPDGPFVITLDLVGAPVVIAQPPHEDERGRITLEAGDARLDARTAQLETIDGIENIGYWTDSRDTASWEFEIKGPGDFDVELVLACEPASAGSAVVIEMGDQKLAGIVPDTASWRTFVAHPAGRIHIASPGRHTLRISVGARFTGALMNLRAVRLARLPTTPAVR